MVITAAVMALAFAGYQASSDSLWWKDPAGSKACSMLADSIDPRTGKVDGTLPNSAAIAVHVKKAKTLDIREETFETGLDDMGYGTITKLEGLHAACVAAGVDMPPYRD